MKPQFLIEEFSLSDICHKAREFVKRQEYDECEFMIQCAMKQYPHAPEPHNLLGIVLEKKGDHIGAMKHFRAAWALDSTYMPARYNLDYYGTFYKKGSCAFDESDCIQEIKKKEVRIEYDEHGVGHVVRGKRK